MTDTAPRIDDFSMDGASFIVLMNAEGQYSLWPSAKAIPEGWERTGPTGSKEECMSFVDSVWTNLMPASLNKS